MKELEKFADFVLKGALLVGLFYTISFWGLIVVGIILLVSLSNEP